MSSLAPAQAVAAISIAARISNEMQARRRALVMRFLSLKI
jgi:hypothetical protein